MSFPKPNFVERYPFFHIKQKNNFMTKQKINNTTKKFSSCKKCYFQTNDFVFFKSKNLFFQTKIYIFSNHHVIQV